MTAVRAADVHTGDSIHEHDWLLRVLSEPTVEGANVAIAVTAGFILHRPSDQVLDVDLAAGGVL